MACVSCVIHGGGIGHAWRMGHRAHRPWRWPLPPAARIIACVAPRVQHNRREQRATVCDLTFGLVLGHVLPDYESYSSKSDPGHHTTAPAPG